MYNWGESLGKGFGKIVLLSIIVACFLMPNVLIAHSIENHDVEDLPTWFVGNYWKYRMDFVFTANKGSSQEFSVDASVTDMYACVSDIVEVGGREAYLLDINGYISGKLSLFELGIKLADFEGDLGGMALIDKDTLGIKKFIFEGNGDVSITPIIRRDMYFNMTIDFVPHFDFFDFPIDPDEDPWEVHIDKATLAVYVDIDIPFGEKEYTSSMSFNDTIKINRTETITVPAGTYDTIVLSGNVGDVSELWYAPDAGYLVKVNEILHWGEDIESVYHLSLIETNYKSENSPPNTPIMPIGPTEGIAEQEYFYSTQTIDPDGDNVYYLFDWGDGTNSGWLGPYRSGEEITVSHIWHTKGVYNVVVKAKDEHGIESDWSQPLGVMIKGEPKFTITIHRIKKKDEIDWSPTDPSPAPEWYYVVSVISGSHSPPKEFCNTVDGNYSHNKDDWISEDEWTPNKEHVFIVNKREIVFTIKLMDYDDPTTEGGDDLADISGCNVPDCKGLDDSTSDKRGAIFYGTYDMVTGKLKEYSENPDDCADFWYKEGEYYITSGDYQPDNSKEYEHGMKDPENDAEIWFKLSTDYRPPVAIIQLEDDYKNLRPCEEIRFLGCVKEGAPPYSWSWDFGDGSVSNEQNPIHVFNEVGKYTVTLTVVDGFNQSNSYSIDVIVKNNDPVLTNGRVEWSGKGTLKDTFTFSVHYMDPDGDIPTVKNVIIDGKPFSLQGYGSDADYKIKLLGTQIGKGRHTFYFYFEDGHGGTAQTSKKTFWIFRSKSSLTGKPAFTVDEISHPLTLLKKLIEYGFFKQIVTKCFKTLLSEIISILHHLSGDFR